MQKFIETTGIEIQIQHWGRNIRLSTEVISVEYFPISIDHGSNEKNLIFSYINYENVEYSCDSRAHMFHIFLNILIGDISVWYVNIIGRNLSLCQAIEVCFGYIFNEHVIIFIWYYNGL